MHVPEAFVDVVERAVMRHVLVDEDLLSEVVVNDARELRAAFDATERRPPPCPPCH